MDTYTGYLVRQHLWRVMVVALLIVAVVVPIHVASNVAYTWEQAVEQGRSGAWDLARYVAFRATDVFSQIFPISVVLGVLWSELTHSLSGRRLMALVAGRSYVAEIRALLFVASMAVVAQFVLDNFARPWSIMTMIDQKVGNHESYVMGADLSHGVWLTTGDAVLQARGVDRGRAMLEAATLYRFGAANTLDEIVVADSLAPAGSGWIMQDGHRIAITGSGEDAGQRPRPVSTRFETEPIDLPVDPLWVEYVGIQTAYVRLADLVRLASSPGIPMHQPDYAAGLQGRLAKPLTPGLLTVLAATAFLLGSRRWNGAIAAGIALAVTYVGIAASNAMGALGQSRVLAGAVGAWFAPLLLALLALVALWSLLRATRMPGPARAAASGTEERAAYPARSAAARPAP